MQRHSKPWTILASLPLLGVSATGAQFVTKAYCIWLSGGFGPGGPAPITGPFWAILFSSLKRPQRESQARWLCSRVASQKTCCSIGRHVESQGEKEEDIINHGLLKAGTEKPGLGRMRTELRRRIFTPLSSLLPLLRELSWTSAQTHAELQKQQDTFLKNELGRGKDLGVGRSEKEPRKDSKV